MPSAAPANVRVVVRVRPLNDSELSLNGNVGRTNVVALESKSNTTQTPETIGINCDTTDSGSSSTGSKYFTFDAVHGPKSNQSEVFESVKEIVDAVTSGYNGTIVAYGQTGSGKSFTVFGNSAGDEQSLGLVQRSLRAIFDKMSTLMGHGVLDGASPDADSVKTEFKASFLEIFNDRVYDLLSSADALDIALSVREDARGVYVDGLKEVVVSSSEAAEKILRCGIANRHVASTNMNRASSRSHAVFTLNIRSEHTTPDGLQKIRLSKFTLVDLAGSERQKKTAVLGERLKEASMINKSLLCLGHVINALVDREAGRERHIPFRDSKLTFLLRDSWGGNSKTCLIATISPSAMSMGETLSTLNFAQRAKLIKNTAILNEDTCGSIVALQAEVSRLRGLLQTKSSSFSGIELTEFASTPEEGCISSFRRLASKAEQRASLLENEVSEQKEVILTLKRKLNEAVMVRKFKERRIDYFQRNEGADEKEHVALLHNEINLLRNELDKPSLSAIHWKAEYERLKEEITRSHNADARKADTTSEDVSRLDDTIQLLIREKEDHIRSINELMQSSSEAQEEIDVLLHEIDRLEVELASSQRKLNAKEIALETAQTELRRLKQKEESWKNEKASFIIHTSTQNELVQKEDEILALKNDLETKKSELQSLEIEKNRLNDEKECTINDLEEKLHSLRNQLAERESYQVDSSTTFDDLHERITKLTAELGASRDDSSIIAEKYEEEYKYISSQLEEQQTTLNETREELAKTKESLSSLKIMMNTCAFNLADVVKEILVSTPTLNNDTFNYTLCGDHNEETFFPTTLELMRQHVSTLCTSLRAMNLELSLKKDEIAIMHHDITSKEHQVSVIIEANRTLNQQIAFIEDNIHLKEIDNENGKKAKELEVLDLKRETGLIVQERDVLRDQICRYTSELEGLQSLLNTRDQEIKDLKSLLRLCEDETRTLGLTVQSLQAERMHLVSSYEGKYSEMADVLVDQERQLFERGKALKRMHHLESDLLRAQSEYSVYMNECQSMITSLQKEISELKETNISLTTAAEQYDMNHILSDRLAAAEEKVLSLTKELSDLGYKYENKLQTIQAKGESASKSVSLLEDRITLLKREKASLTTELDHFIKEVQTLNERVDVLERENALFKQESSPRRERFATDDKECSSINGEIPTYETACYSALSDEMDNFLSRLTAASSAACKDSVIDETMDESLFLPNNDTGLQSSFPKENDNPKNDYGIETPSKREYGSRRQPLSDLKQTLATPLTPHIKDSKVSTKKKLKSGNKHRSNWMIYDNSKIFDH